MRNTDKERARKIATKMLSLDPRGEAPASTPQKDLRCLAETFLEMLDGRHPFETYELQFKNGSVVHLRGSEEHPLGTPPYGSKVGKPGDSQS